MTTASYRKLFDPTQPPEGEDFSHEFVGDRAPPSVFRFDDEGLVLALNIALATRRPLLLRGQSGVGKSSVGRAVAWHQGWSYVQMTVTSRTLARDFLFQLDDLKRLQDAYAQSALDDWRRYLIPGPLFWAFDPTYAKSIVHSTNRASLIPTGVRANECRTVVLIDEIDKADPDVPNNLLEPLGRLSFEAPELPHAVIAKPDGAPLIVLTTNEERDLPDAFLRRCIEYRIDPPTEEGLRRIGDAHFQKLDPQHHDLAVSLRPRNPAEYLDAIRACRELSNTTTTATDLKVIIQAIVGRAANEAAS